MGYRIERDEPVDDAIRRIAHEQIDKALAELDDESLPRHETVHQVRKRCKKVRGLVRLVRPSFAETYQRENAWYRDAARPLSKIRDAESALETYDALADRFSDLFADGAFKSVRERLAKRRRQVSQKKGLGEELELFHHRMAVGRERVADWRLDDDGFDAIAAGLAKTYRRARKAMETALERPTAENFHQWRKRIKHHWHHARLLKPAWPEGIGAHRDAADRLADLLGDAHDLAVLGGILVAEPAAFGDETTVESFLALANRRRLELRERAQQLGRRLLAEKPKQLCRRFRTYWDVWRDDSAGRYVEIDAHRPVAGAK